MKNRRIFSVFLLVVLILTTVLPPSVSAVEEMDVAAKAALLIDPTTEEILYEENIHERLYPASLTKVMTALLVLEAVENGTLTLDQELAASQYAIESIPYDASTANIKVGETLSVETLLYCILVVSANEACNILGEAIAGSVDAFVEMMNEKAAALGCEDTHFVTPNGLHDDNHYTTAWDLYLITKAALEYDLFMEVADTRYFTIPATYYNKERTYYTTNFLLSPYRAAGYVYKYAHGVKTGFTSKAGNCLISTAEKDDRQLLGVILGAEKVPLESGGTQVQSFSEMTRLFTWGFDNFTRQEIISSDELVYELSVTLSEKDFVVLHPAYDMERLLPNDINVEDLQRKFTLVGESVEAPIAAGTELGSVEISYGDTVYATIPLLANTNVDASRLLVFRRDVLEFVQRRDVQLIAIAVVAALILLIIIIKLTGRRRNRYGRRNGYAHNRAYRGRRR